MISERSSFLDNEVSKFVDETLATPSLPSAASLKLIPGGELIFRERPKIFFVLFCFFFQKINQCSNCHQTQSIENVVLTSMFVKVEFQKFKKKRVNMGAAELEEKMMSTLKLYAKIQAVQGIFMVLMPYQAAVLVGYDKGSFLFFSFRRRRHIHAIARSSAAAPAIFLVGLVYIGLAVQYSYGAHCESRYVLL